MTRRRRRGSKATKPLQGRLLVANFIALAHELESIAKGEGLDAEVMPPADEGSAARWKAIAALEEIHRFLMSSGDYVSTVLYQLKLDLRALEATGETRPIFLRSKKKGRKPDERHVQCLKGLHAGFAYLLMEAGVPRNQAAQRVARDIQSNDARLISSKPIKPSTIKEWMQQYGCSVEARRGLRTLKSPKEFHNYLGKIGRSKKIEHSFGEIHCLMTLYNGRRCLLAGDMSPFLEWSNYWRQIFTPQILEVMDDHLRSSG
jgi:hypothetical protein